MRYRDYLIKRSRADYRYLIPAKFGLNAAALGYIVASSRGMSYKDRLKTSLKWGVAGALLGAPIGQLVNLAEPSEQPAQPTEPPKASVWSDKTRRKAEEIEQIKADRRSAREAERKQKEQSSQHGSVSGGIGTIGN